MQLTELTMMASRRSKSDARGRKAQLVELLVDGGFLLDVEVAGGDVGFGLVVVVVADEVFDGVAGEELLELVVELGGERLVVGQDERGPVGLLDDLGHGEGFAGAGDAEQHLVLLAGGEPFDELFDGAGLVASGLVGGDQLKIHWEIIDEERRLGEGGMANRGCHAAFGGNERSQRKVLALPENEATSLRSYGCRRLRP